MTAKQNGIQATRVDSKQQRHCKTYSTNIPTTTRDACTRCAAHTSASPQHPEAHALTCMARRRRVRASLGSSLYDGRSKATTGSGFIRPTRPAPGPGSVSPSSHRAVSTPRYAACPRGLSRLRHGKNIGVTKDGAQQSGENWTERYADAQPNNAAATFCNNTSDTGRE